MVNFKLKNLILFLLFFIVFGQQNFASTKNCTLKIKNSSGNFVALNVEIASTPKERERGLMFRTSLGENNGMLFIFEYDDYLSFWMKNTVIPLDIAFVDSHGIIRDIYQMIPLDTSIFYNSSIPVRYAIEVNQWWFKKNNIAKGAKVFLNGCIGK